MKDHLADHSKGWVEDLVAAGLDQATAEQVVDDLVTELRLQALARVSTRRLLEVGAKRQS